MLLNKSRFLYQYRAFCNNDLLGVIFIRKIWRIIFPIIISALLVNLQFSTSTFNVNVGDKIDYFISEASLEATIGSDYLEISGISINEKNVEEGNSLSVEINDISSLGVSATFAAMGFEVPSIIRVDVVEYLIPFSVTYVFSIMLSFANDWSNTETLFAEGYNILFLPTFAPFIDITESTWEFIEMYSYNFAHYFLTATNDNANFTIDYTSRTRNDVFTAEWVVEMIDIRSNELFISNITGVSHYQISIHKSTGIVLGTRYDGSCSGELNGYAVNVSASLLFEEVDYNMPAFKLQPSQGASAIGFISSIVCIFGISSVLNFSKKRKR